VTTESLTPVRVDLDNIIDLATNGGHSCAVVRSGEVYCWGVNDWGQLGLGDYDPRAVPTIVPGISNAVAVDVGGETACVLLDDETVRCWGRNEQGQVGTGYVGSKPNTPQVVSGLGEVAQVSVGRWMSCAIQTGGQAYCWGEDDKGELGNGDTTTSQQFTPVAVNNLDDAVAINAGYSHVCAVRDSGQVVCWGEGESGELGDGDIHNVDEPVPVDEITNAIDVSVSMNSSCALLDDETVHCWGDNTDGQLGSGSDDSSATPVEVTGLTGVTQLSSRSAHLSTHVCVSIEDSAISCWGGNGDGQLGDRTTSPRNHPGPVTLW
jgi:alpha-tubulin suppressor-like RCC1 family protein